MDEYRSFIAAARLIINAVISITVAVFICRDAKKQGVLILQTPVWLWFLVGLALHVFGLALYWAAHYWPPVRDSWREKVQAS